MRDYREAIRKIQEIKSNPFKYGSPYVDKYDLIRGLNLANSRIEILADIILKLLPDPEEGEE